jgi:hypothetical protein
MADKNSGSETIVDRRLTSSKYLDRKPFPTFSSFDHHQRHRPPAMDNSNMLEAILFGLDYEQYQYTPSPVKPSQSTTCSSESNDNNSTTDGSNRRRPLSNLCPGDPSLLRTRSRSFVATTHTTNVDIGYKYDLDLAIAPSPSPDSLVFGHEWSAASNPAFPDNEVKAATPEELSPKLKQFDVELPAMEMEVGKAMRVTSPKNLGGVVKDLFGEADEGPGEVDSPAQQADDKKEEKRGSETMACFKFPKSAFTEEPRTPSAPKPFRSHAKPTTLSTLSTSSDEEFDISKPVPRKAFKHRVKPTPYPAKIARVVKANRESFVFHVPRSSSPLRVHPPICAEPYGYEPFCSATSSTGGPGVGGAKRFCFVPEVARDIARVGLGDELRDAMLENLGLSGMVPVFKRAFQEAGRRVKLRGALEVSKRLGSEFGPASWVAKVVLLG